MKRIFFVLLLISGSAFSAIQLKLDKSAGRSNFLAIGNPSAIRIEGQGEAPAGELQVIDQAGFWVLSGQLALDLKSYSTGIQLRDRHMKEKYLEVEKFQSATLKIDELKIAKDILTKETESSVPFTGQLDFHGARKPVEGNLLIKKENAKIQVSSKFWIKLSDFQLETPQFAGIKVADRVEISTLNQVDPF